MRRDAIGAAHTLLDVGCGCGWSSYCFARVGYETTGIDLNPVAFEPPSLPNLRLQEGSALNLPFRNETFDVVVSYQCLEHVPDPKLALDEMVRVTKPGGMVCVVGPNLLSPLLPLRFLALDALNRKLQFRRVAETPKHPYGNTAQEYLTSLVSVIYRLAKKILNSEPTFNMRVPDMVPPFLGDNDACYLCTPLDLVHFFERQRCRVVQNGKHGRPPGSSLFAGGTWVAAEKNRELGPKEEKRIKRMASLGAT